MTMIEVDGVAVRAPFSFKWSKNDISGPNAGRTLDGTMHKNRIAEKRKLSLTWKGIRPEQVSAILQAFEPEYVSVSYPDALNGNTSTRTFYTGDLDAEIYSWTVNNKLYSLLSFSIIER